MFGADENIDDAGKLYTVITDPLLERSLVDLLGVDCSDRPPASAAVSSGSCPRERSESGEEGPEDPWVHLPLTPWPSCLSSHSLSSVSSGSALPYSSCPGWNWVLNRFRLSSTRRLHSITADLSLNCPYPTPARSAQSFEPGFPWSGQVLFQTYTSREAALEGWWRPGPPTPLRMQSHQYWLCLLRSQSRPVWQGIQEEQLGGPLPPSVAEHHICLRHLHKAKTLVHGSLSCDHGQLLPRIKHH